MTGDLARLEPLIRLSMARGVGPQRFAALVERFGSVEGVLRAPRRELEAVPGVGSSVAAEIQEVASPAGRTRLSRALASIERLEAAVFTPEDVRYPAAFRVLPDPPFIVFAAGDLELLSRPSVAVVGTRSPTRYGREATATLAGGLARAGYCIVSGAARGIDTAAHRAALEAGGATVAVLGHGIDQVYPPENGELFARLRQQGLLLTEMAPGERPFAGNFPRRNRLIAALSRAVLVIEMGLKSGAQHTVTYALELGREVLAVPGPISSPGSTGTNQLIKEGARLVASVEDVLEELEGVGVPRAQAPGLSRPEPQAALALLQPEEERVLAALSHEPLHPDDLAADAGIPVRSLLGILLELELKGLAEALPGHRYRRRRAAPLALVP